MWPISRSLASLRLADCCCCGYDNAPISGFPLILLQQQGSLAVSGVGVRGYTMHAHHGFRGVHVLFIGLHVVWIRRTMASATADDVSVRDPLNESGDIETLILGQLSLASLRGR